MIGMRAIIAVGFLSMLVPFALIGQGAPAGSPSCVCARELEPDRSELLADQPAELPAELASELPPELASELPPELASCNGSTCSSRLDETELADSVDGSGALRVSGSDGASRRADP